VSLDGVEVPAVYSTVEQEVSAIRNRVGLSVHPHLCILRYTDDDAIDAVQEKLPMNPGIREGQMKQGLLLDDAGRPIADLLVGFLRGQLLVLGRGMPRAELTAALGGGDPMHEDHTVLGVDGPFAWELMALWDSPGIVGLPYLGVFFADDQTIVVRAGRTGEYGYLLVVPHGSADNTWATLKESGRGMDTIAVGSDALRHCALENWVFDPYREGGAALDALELQLRWRVDFGQSSAGLDALRKRGLSRRITAMTIAGDVAAGAPVTSDGATIGSVLTSVPEIGGSTRRVLAVLDLPFAQPGIDQYQIEGRPCRTLSPPWVLNLSLFVNPQKHDFERRDEIDLPPELACARSMP